MTTLRIGPAPATVRSVRNLRRAAARLNRDMSFGLTAAMSDQRSDLVRQWRRELRSVQPYTARGLRWEGSTPGRTLAARLFLTPEVDRYMRLHLRGGTRRFRGGRIIHLPRLPASVRNNARDPARFEIPLDGGPNTIILLRRPGRNRVIGFRVFETRYLIRASGEDYIARRLPSFIEVRVSTAGERLLRRING